MHPFSTLSLFFLWCFQGVEKECIGNEWVNIGKRTGYQFTMLSPLKLVLTIPINKKATILQVLLSFPVSYHNVSNHIYEKNGFWFRWFLLRVLTSNWQKWINLFFLFIAIKQLSRKNISSKLWIKIRLVSLLEVYFL